MCLACSAALAELTQGPWFVLSWPQATGVFVLGEEGVLLLQLVLWKTHTIHTHTHTHTHTHDKGS